VFIEAKDKGGGGDNWTTGAISRAKLQPYHHHQQTNIQSFTGRMPFLSPNQQCQSTEGKIIQHNTQTLSSSKHQIIPSTAEYHKPHLFGANMTECAIYHS